MNTSYRNAGVGTIIHLLHIHKLSDQRCVLMKLLLAVFLPFCCTEWELLDTEWISPQEIAQMLRCEGTIHLGCEHLVLPSVSLNPKAKNLSTFIAEVCCVICRLTYTRTNSATFRKQSIEMLYVSRLLIQQLRSNPNERQIYLICCGLYSATTQSAKFYSICMLLDCKSETVGVFKSVWKSPRQTVFLLWVKWSPKSVEAVLELISYNPLFLCIFSLFRCSNFLHCV